VVAGSPNGRHEATPDQTNPPGGPDEAGNQHDEDKARARAERAGAGRRLIGWGGENPNIVPSDGSRVVTRVAPARKI